MADRFRTFKIIPANTGANTLFTVPTANVAASPPVPVTTFILKTIILHNKSGSGSLDAVMTYSSNAVDYEINNVVQGGKIVIKEDFEKGRIKFLFLFFIFLFPSIVFLLCDALFSQAKVK